MLSTGTFVVSFLLICSEPLFVISFRNNDILTNDSENVERMRRDGSPRLGFVCLVVRHDMTNSGISSNHACLAADDLNGHMTRAESGGGLTASGNGPAEGGGGCPASGSLAGNAKGGCKYSKE